MTIYASLEEYGFSCQNRHFMNHPLQCYNVTKKKKIVDHDGFGIKENSILSSSNPLGVVLFFLQHKK